MNYRYHWTFKLLAFVLAVVSGASLMIGAVGLILGEPVNYYERRRQSQMYSEASWFCERAIEAVFDRYAWEKSGIEPEFYERFFDWGADVDAADDLEYDFYYVITSSLTGQVVQTNASSDVEEEWWSEKILSTRLGRVTEMPKCNYYPTYQEFMTGAETGMSYLDLEGNPIPALDEGIQEYVYYVVSDDSSVNWDNTSREHYYNADANGAEYTIYRMELGAYDTYEVAVFMTAEQMTQVLDSPLDEEYLYKLVTDNQSLIHNLAISGLAGLLISLLWLALTAGKGPHSESVRPEGLNVIPLDVYLGLEIFGQVLVIAVAGGGLNQVVWNSAYGNYDGTALENLFWDTAMYLLLGAASGLMLSLFVMACAAQMKVGGNYWMKNSLIGTCWKWGRIVLAESVKGLWKMVKAVFRWFAGFFVWIGGCFKRLGDLLPLTWQWLVASGAVWIFMLICFVFGFGNYSVLPIFFGILVTVLLVLYGAYCFGALRDAAKKMSEGHLEEKIENKYMAGCFGEFAGHLNALGDTCVEAARQQMKSERMKSELITNVSHDIKTPLTSIINYVDLLQKAESETQRKEYLEVLDRQSQRLKKLIEDLMEMSRASSGNVSVEITPTDVCEAVNQALGEFADTLETCSLQVMLKAPAGPLMALCDGKHLWRVLSNVLGNVVKYALPGTRVYVDVARRDQKVEISVKNISARMLNITADELMERFVRGDASRNTEGNGLGLNIAKSLMEIQGGRLDLVVDGDLFKVILTLNGAGAVPNTRTDPVQ